MLFYDIDPAAPSARPRMHGDLCTPECDELSRRCHLARRRRKPPVPAVACPHCEAGPGSPCRAMTGDRRRLTHSRQECHPSRLEAIAA